MRRSKTLSNIPLPSNARRDSSKLTRATSFLRTRDPSLDRQTPLAYRLETPTLSTAKWGAACTPVNSGFKRSGSVSSFGSRISNTRNKSPLERKTIQKIINDKKWLAEHHSKIKTFIQTSGLFNPELSGMLRPPTINTVVELFSVLFSKLVKTDPINSQSYADVGLKTLKLLNYPGSLTLSTLRTANTMHGWPHFIFMMSWLIDRVNLSSINYNFIEQQDDSVKQMYNLQDCVFEFLTTQHSINAGNEAPDPNLLKQSEEKLIYDMCVFTGTDLEAVKKLEEPIKVLRAAVVELEAKIQEITEEIRKIQSENSERQEIIKNFKESSNTKEQDLEDELSQLKKFYLKQLERENNLTLSVKELENIVASQSGRYEEKNRILGQIEDLQRAIGRKQRKQAEYRAVKDQLDFELGTMVKEIEAKVDSWNVSITKTLLPEMQNLRLREKGFHSKGFIEELREILEEKEDITKQLLHEYNGITMNLKKIKNKRESLEKNNKSLNSTKEKLDRLRSSVQNFKEENRKLVLKIDKVKKQFELNAVEIEHMENMKIKEMNTELAELDNRIQKLTEKIDNAAKKGLGVLTEAHKMAIQSMQTIDEVMHSMLKNVTDKAEQSKFNLMETYNYLLSIQAKSLTMPHDLNASQEENENVTDN